MKVTQKINACHLLAFGQRLNFLANYLERGAMGFKANELKDRVTNKTKKIILLTTWWSWTPVSTFASAPDISSHVIGLVVCPARHWGAVAVPGGSSLHWTPISGSPIALASGFTLGWGAPVVGLCSTTASGPHVRTSPLAGASRSPHCVVLRLGSP